MLPLTLNFTVEPTLICIDLKPLEHLVVEYSTSAQQLPGWLLFAFSLFFTGLVGMVYNRASLLLTIMCIEMMYLGAVTSFVLYGITFHDARASVYALLILIFGACECAVGLGLLVTLFRFGNTIAVRDFSVLGA